MVTKVSYILIENVQGFETSDTRDSLVQFFQENEYIYQEFLLTPLQFSIPNSRLRYYCLARHSSAGQFSFACSSNVSLPAIYSLCVPLNQHIIHVKYKFHSLLACDVYCSFYIMSNMLSFFIQPISTYLSLSVFTGCARHIGWLPITT